MKKAAEEISRRAALRATGSAALLFATGTIAWSQESTVDRRRIAEEIVALVRDHFYDAARADTWVKSTGADLPSRVAAAPMEDAAVETIRKALAALKASHTEYHNRDEPAYYGLLSIFRDILRLGEGAAIVESIGCDCTPEGFVRVVFAGSPADGAGLKRGDRIVAADGAPFHPIRSLRGKAGTPITLTLQRTEKGPALTLSVIPRRIEPRAEWLEHQNKAASVTTAPNGKRIGYVPLYCGGGEEFEQAVRDALPTTFATADALILDFRDGWGGASPSFVTMFDRHPPLLKSIDRAGKAYQYDTQWRKPLVVLINGGVRSGKEVVAYAIKKHQLGTLVGARAAGAVLAGQCFPLSDHRSLLYLAASDVRVDGERLEGIGVAPDIAVPDPLPYAAGTDPQRDRAFAEATRLAAYSSG